MNRALGFHQECSGSIPGMLDKEVLVQIFLRTLRFPHGSRVYRSHSMPSVLQTWTVGNSPQFLHGHFAVFHIVIEGRLVGSFKIHT